ncbi:alpha/beta fold hydrolase [Nocardia sp. NPDC127526]|uniref:alpha/beta fold hydrolase n=1 Tax=Nocardia sp. NPDC127526 TaxID=3345393 RepID=UPI0036447025
MRALSTRTLYTAAAVSLSAILLTGCGTADNNAATATTSAVSQPDQPSADGKGFYAPVNGLRLYYEVHGSGRPLILVHGGLSTVDSTFGALLPELAETRKVIAVELQGHGHTADIDRPLRYQSMADDVAGLIGHLNLGKADVLGYSLGGGVALQLAARNPDLVNKLIVTSAPYRSDGWLPETRAGMAAMNPEAMLDTPIHAVYAQSAPNPSDWPALVTKTRQLLSEDYDWTTDLAAIQAPALLVTAESDALSRAHAEEMVTRLTGAGNGASTLAVVPGTTHYDIMYRADLLLPLFEPFLGTASS